MDLEQQTPEDILKRAYELHEVLESERQQLKLYSIMSTQIVPYRNPLCIHRNIHN